MIKPHEVKAAAELAEQRSVGTVSEERKDTRNIDSAVMLPYWQKADDVIGGLESMIAAAEKRLPKFPDEDKDSYDFRLSYAKMTNVYTDILGGLASKPFTKEIVIEGTKTPEIEEFLEDVDGSGNNITQFSSEVFFYGINNAIDWIFVDYPKYDPTIRTIADAKKANIRPFWSRVMAENVLEIRSTHINSKELLTYFRMLEHDNGKKYVREFERLESGVIDWSLWEKNADGKWSKIDEGVLGIDVIPMVPFITGRRKGKSWQFNPPLRDALDLQITLYRQETGLEFVKVMSCYPMLTGNGVKPPMAADGRTIAKVAVGPQRVLYAPPDGNGNSGSWAYVEPGAQSLTFLKTDITETKEDLRELGKQPLTAQSGNITVISSAVAAGKAKSAVNAWGLALKDTLENCLRINAKWMRQEFEPSVIVYDDYDNYTEGAVEAIVEARKNKDISRKAYLNELQRRSILSSDFDFDDDAAELLEEMPSELGEDDQEDTEPGAGNTPGKKPATEPGGLKVPKMPRVG